MISPETQRYSKLRFGAGAAMIVTFGLLLWLGLRAWPIAQQALWPDTVGCSCGITAMTTVPPVFAATAGAVVLISFLVFARFAWFLTRHVQRSQRMVHEWTADGHRIVYHQAVGEHIMIMTRPGRQAMTMGLIQPRIYITADLTTSLSGSELAAVLRHEQAHCRRFDQLWSAILDSFSAAWRRPAMLQQLVAANLSLREIAADAAATSGYQQTIGLTGAIVKLSTIELMPDTVGFSPNQDRVEKLLNADWQPRLTLWRWSYAVGLGVIAVFIGLAIRLTPPAAASMSPVVVRACQETRLLCPRIEAVPFRLFFQSPVPQSLYVFPDQSF